MIRFHQNDKWWYMSKKLTIQLLMSSSFKDKMSWIMLTSRSNEINCEIFWSMWRKKCCLFSWHISCNKNNWSIFNIYQIAISRIIDNIMSFIVLIVDRWNKTCFVINRCFRVDLFVANDVYTFQIFSKRFSQYYVSSIQTSKSFNQIINRIISTTSKYLSRNIHVVVEKISRFESLQCREQISINFDERIDMISRHSWNIRIDNFCEISYTSRRSFSNYQCVNDWH
jgi:hypothetical protein